MNLIEHVWEYIDRCICKRPHVARNLDELWAWIEEEWYAIPLDYIQSLYGSMTQRVADLKEAEGWNTEW